MRSQLWIINSAFIALFVVVALILVVGRPSVVLPRKIDFSGQSMMEHASVVLPIDIAYIYEHDPFGTLGGPKIIAPTEPPKALVVPVPLLPVKEQGSYEQPVAPTFLPPLTVVLKGIIYGTQEHDHRAIVEDKKTKREGLYRVGDTILDAEIIRIENNKIMFLRSNGQQETVYVSSIEAHKDPLYQKVEGKYAAVIPIKKVSESQFIVDPHLFVLYINNLAQFLDALDITTVFEKGRSIGCRIGNITSNSIGSLCGLQAGDIVTEINQISTATTKERLAIYHQIINMQEGSVIKVSVIRGESRQKLAMTYTLTSFAPRRPAPAAQSSLSQPVFQNSPRSDVVASRRQNSNTMEEVVEKMRKNDKRAMVNYSGKSRPQRFIRR